MRKLILVAVVGLIALVNQTLAQTIEPPKALESVNALPPFTAWNGSFTYNVPIEVPGFRGLEPRLSLSYNSASGLRSFRNADAMMGIGWSLNGISVIERVSGSKQIVVAGGGHKAAGGMGTGVYQETYPENGMPADNFSLDGRELFPCIEVNNQATTPSCAAAVAGGFTAYASRVETYLRIRRKNGTENRWEVTFPNGIKNTYESLEALSPPSTFRWYLTKTEDLRGNHVDFIYAGAEHRLWKINYVNASPSAAQVGQIEFYYDTRPDVISFSDGNAIRTVDKRLRAIDVRSAGGQVRSYALTYEQKNSGGFLGPSRLIKVQQYAKGAMISATGAVSSSAALPAYEFAYQDPIIGLPESTETISKFDLGTSTDQPTFVVKKGTLDFNGDGRTDVIVRYGTGTIAVRKFFATGFIETTMPADLRTAVAPGYINLGDLTDFLADFDGDGRDDILMLQRSGSSGNYTHKLLVAISDGNPVTRYTWATQSSSAQTEFDGGIAHLGDFNGDGKTDLLTFGDHVWLSTGTDFELQTAANWTNIPDIANSAVTFSESSMPNLGDWNDEIHKTGDFNGDGKTDLIINDAYVHLTPKTLPAFKPRVYLSNGSGFVQQPAPGNLTASLIPWTSYDGEKVDQPQVAVSDKARSLVM